MATIHEAICAAMMDVNPIAKNRQNKQQGFSFRSIDDAYNALQPILAKHGIFSVSDVLDEKTENRKSSKGNALIYRVLRIKYTFYSADGTSVESTVIGEGMDSGDKAANKAMAVAHKYALLQLFAVPTDDMVDPDAETHQVAAREPEPQPDAEPMTPKTRRKLHVVGMKYYGGDKAKWDEGRAEWVAWAGCTTGSASDLTEEQARAIIAQMEGPNNG